TEIFMTRRWTAHRADLGDPVTWAKRVPSFVITTLDNCLACVEAPINTTRSRQLLMVGNDMVKPGLHSPAGPLNMIDALRRCDLQHTNRSAISAVFGQMWRGRRGFTCSF